MSIRPTAEDRAYSRGLRDGQMLAKGLGRTHNMHLNDYQVLAGKFAVYPNRGNNLTYTTLGLCGEAGEVAEKVKKFERGDTDKLELHTQLFKELGDVLWYVSQMAHELGTNLEFIAGLNIQKLQDRADRNQIKGSGDNR